MELTIAQMFDQLCTVNQKLFKMEDLKRDKEADDKVIADATRTTNSLNTQRNDLIAELDIALNKIAEGKQQQIFYAHKMYGK